MQNAVVSSFPGSPASRVFADMARKIIRDKDFGIKGGIQFFLGNIFKVGDNVTV